MTINNLFSTKERVRILKNVIFTEEPISVNAVASRLNISKGMVSKYLDLLLKEGVARKPNGKYIIFDSVVTRAVKIFLNLADIDLGIFKKFDFVEAAGLYGSCAKGEDTVGSDADIWVLIREVPDDKLAPLTVLIKKHLKKAKPLFLTAKKLEKIKKEDELFYHALAFGSVIIYGDKDALQL